MKIAPLLRSAATLLIASLLLFSCGRVDFSEAKHQQAHNALRQFVAETQISLLEHKPPNSSDFLGRVEFELSSTNKAARALKSACDIVWINSNLNDWLVSLSNGRPASPTAIVGKYQVEGRSYFQAITFDGRPVQHNGPPDSGFTKFGLKNREIAH